ncbi:cytosolic leucyl tRNA synthetase [Toensbergia leucococca]|nr:cytosolic leucyl tRNA synthetase [Toensbergia leucococca]
MATNTANHDAIDPGNGSKNTLKLENTEKRDTLIAIEKRYQAKWQKSKIFQATAPSASEVPIGSITPDELRQKYPKYFGIFAYPYTNGTLHVGHSFTVSKVEFTAGFSRMQGKRVLFPLGFHLTGMPIKACADKLAEDVRKFGKNFEHYVEEEPSHDRHGGSPAAPTQAQTKDDITKFTSSKSKAAAKTVKLKYQFQIMLALGIPREEIYKFADTAHWLQFFPPLLKQDLNDIGARIDWRRSFVTTDANPYYDAFVRWQMHRLKELDKIQYGIRYTVYSPKDGQPCMDHDRTEGEGVAPQDYTALKLRVKKWAPKAAELIRGKIPERANVYFVPATLRPETMYGQTCCFVGPKIMYGIFKVSENEYYVVTKRAAWNMAFQGTFFKSDSFPRNAKELSAVVDVSGSSVVGTLVTAPLSIHTQGVRILPMDSVLPTKGTGVVTSVPSDSPDDYATVRDLAKKAEYYNIEKEWAELEIPEIIQTPAYGNLTAKFLVENMKINSPKDAKQLAEAKDLAYKEGYYKGIMLMGDFKGEKVEAAKPKVKEALIKSGEAFEYAEPNGHVVSRSGDDCVVAYLGQWFLNYGENDPEWRQQVLDYVGSDMKSYAMETKNQFEKNLEWLNRWACARTYGLGSKLPWDPKFLVESLSDSTIYMAYYTIAHFLHSDIFGSQPGLFDIKADQMIDEVWDYVFCRREIDDDLLRQSGIKKADLESMRREFEYWYPLDMSVSGKDLIPNHLTFFLYIHVALFPREYWPKGVRANGHLLLNGEKMSKSTGNFLTLNDAVKKYGADASRIALADAGDGVEDANFEESVANSSILRLFTLKEWSEEVVKDEALRKGKADTFWDDLFENEMNVLVHEAKKHYEDTDYKLALKSALYDFTSSRDFYREATSAAGIGMHHDLVIRYLELQALLLTPIAPHWADYIWQEVLGKPSTIQNEVWPTVPGAKTALSAAREYVRSTSSNITSAEAAQQKKKDKGKNIAFDPKLPKKLSIFAAAKYPAWQEKYIDLVRDAFDGTTLDDKDLNPKIAKMGEMKKAMPFVQGLKKRLMGGEDAQTVFDRKLAFDELQTLKEMAAGLKRTTGCHSVDIVAVDEGGKSGRLILEGQAKREPLPPVADSAVPGNPSFYFENVA